ncbi:MAG: MFS transporter [Caldiserica bacterium]|nr:MFS transporter [Caldisericota bacterium]
MLNLKWQHPSGFRAFLLVWSGQVLSMVGSAMTAFALSIWAYQKTGLATSLALVDFFFLGATIVATPLAGVYVDRWNRKLTMMLSDLLAVTATIVALVLYLSGHLQIWHLYVAASVQGIGSAFQWTAYSAAISQMMPKEHYARASGLMSLADFGSIIVAPVLAGLLIRFIHVGGIMTIDIITFGVAVLALLVVEIPRHVPDVSAQESMWRQMTFGFRFIRERGPLLSLLSVFAVSNFMISLSNPLFTPMILARTGQDAAALGFVQSAVGIGGALGGFLLGVWGGPKNKVRGILLGDPLSFIVLGSCVFFGRGPVVWAAGFLVSACVGSMVNGLSQSIWQAKVPPGLQGRVFSARRMIAWIVMPVATLLAGPLADKVLEPAMRPGGFLVPVFARVTGTGAGAGMAVLFLLSATAASAVTLAGFLMPRLRNLEKLLPDHDVVLASITGAEVAAEQAMCDE